MKVISDSSVNIVLMNLKFWKFTDTANLP